MCRLCRESPEYVPGHLRKCGFSTLNGAEVFDPENYACATLNRLKSYAVSFGRAVSAYECGRIWVLPYPAGGGWIVMTSASPASGMVDGAVYMKDDHGYLLPLPIAEKAIEYYRGLACSQDCEVLP